MRERLKRIIRCFFGLHVAEAKQWNPFPYPHRIYCPACQRTLYFRDDHATISVYRNGIVTERSGIRYRSMDQWREEHS